jgi:tetratricopeptide (TPR) repeat protein
MTLVVVIVVLVLVLFVFRSFFLGSNYKKFLETTQVNLISSNYSDLSLGDIYDFCTTGTCSSIRWILQQEYYSLYINKEYQVLEKLMDTAMVNLGTYSTIDEWITGKITKQSAIYRLRERNPDKYRKIFDCALGEISLQEDNKTIELDPYDAGAYYNRGISKHEVGDYKGAIQDYNKAIELNTPNLAQAYSNRGVSKSELEDYMGAIEDYNKTIELNPNDGMAYNNRGLANIFLGQKDSGCLDLYKASELGYKDAHNLIRKHCQ